MWVLFLFWLHPFIPSGVNSPLISSSVLGAYRLGEFLFQYPIILPFHTVHGVRSMNQHKLEVIKQEMARVNVDILGIRQEWVNLTQMTIISTTVGKNPLEETE